MPWIRLRIRLALGGIVMSSASSTARHDATACTTVQTPKIRCVNAQASRGSRPFMIVSMPRNCVDVAHALVMRPFSAWASMRRCPSIRVMGSTTILVVAIARTSRFLLGWGFDYRQGFAALPHLMHAGRDGVRGDTGGRAHREREADRVGIAFHAEAGDVRQAAIERRHRVPEVPFGAAEAGMARPDGPAGAAIPLEDRAGREGGRSLAADVIQTPALARRLVVERFDELAGVEVRAARALIVNPRAVGEQGPAVVIELGHAAEREEVHDCRRDDVADRP